MRTLFLTLCSIVLLMFAGCGGQEASGPPDAPVAAPEPPAPRTVRVLVIPFQDRNPHDETAYVSMGLAAFATARFEELSRSLDAAKVGLKLEAVVGPHGYPAEAARLRADRRAPLDAAAVLAEAQRSGATHVLTGSYGGRVEKWTLETEVHEVRPDGLVLAGRAAETRKIFAWPRDVPKPTHPGHQLATVHSMFGVGAASAFGKAQVTLPPEALAALSTPQVPDAVAFIRLSEAYRALLLGSGEEAMELALDKAESAVRIWPDYQAGLRLYAWLLWQRGRTVAARKQYGEALARDPADVRALVALGRVEIAEKQYGAARDALREAVALRPDDAVIHFWLGEAHARLGDVTEAITHHERSLALDPANLDTHRALAGLYAGERRYGDAAKQLSAVVDGEPSNLEAVFLLAACLRASGQEAAAIEAYDRAAPRFPTEARLPKFRGDLLAARHAAGPAESAYAEARRIAPSDARWSDPSIAFGAALAAAVRRVQDVRLDMESRRSEFQLAVSDGVWDLGWNGAKACADGRAGSSFLLASSVGASYDARGEELQRGVRTLRASLKNGEGAALTPDELSLAEELLRYEGIALRDLREMRTGHAGLKSSLARHGCDLDRTRIHAASIDAVRARNLERSVTMPVPPARDGSGISPVVPTDARRVVKFMLENLGRQAYVLVLDGKAFEPAIEPGARETYSTTLGRHRFCLLPKGREADCEQSGNIRAADFHEGWTSIIRQDP